MAGNPLPKIKLRCLPGKEYGAHAGYDHEGRELIYIGVEDMQMHKDVLDHIESEWKRIFGP